MLIGDWCSLVDVLELAVWKLPSVRPRVKIWQVPLDALEVFHT